MFSLSDAPLSDCSSKFAFLQLQAGIGACDGACDGAETEVSANSNENVSAKLMFLTQLDKDWSFSPLIWQGAGRVSMCEMSNEIQTCCRRARPRRFESCTWKNVCMKERNRTFVAMMLAAAPPRADWRVDRNARLVLYLHFSGHFLPRTTKKRTFHSWEQWSFVSQRFKDIQRLYGKVCFTAKLIASFH